MECEKFISPQDMLILESDALPKRFPYVYQAVKYTELPKNNSAVKYRLALLLCFFLHQYISKTNSNTDEGIINAYKYKY